MGNQTGTVRFATEQDVPSILRFICELAEYEHMSDQIVATEQRLRETLFEKHQAEVILVEEEGKPVGFALFYTTYSTFLARAGIHLEDLYVQPSCRGRGYGKLLLSRLAQLCGERELGRLEWNCLDWNESSIRFYRAMGAVSLDEWMTFRVAGDSLPKLAARK